MIPAVILAAALRVAFVGDSITASHYPEIAASALHTRLYRYAIPGADTRRIAHLVDRALKIHPTHVVLFAGINDCSKVARPDPYAIFDRIARMVSRILDAGAIPIVVGLHRTPGNRGITANCEDVVNIQLCDFPVGVRRVGWEGPRGMTNQDGELYDRYDAGDGIHPNYEGQKKLAAMVVAAIKEKP